jgi:hypothetical protein
MFIIAKNCTIRDGGGSHGPKDGPFEISEAEGKSLIANGHAIPANSEEQTAPAEQEAQIAPELPQVDIDTLTVAQLKEMLKDADVAIPRNAAKAALVELARQLNEAAE